MKWIYSKGRGFQLEISQRMVFTIYALTIYLVHGKDALPDLASIRRAVAVVSGW